MRGNDHVRFNGFTWIIIISFLLTLSSPVILFAENKRADDLKPTGKYSAKNEVVYGNLNANGHVQNMYVVNNFSITEQGQIIDHGKYKNLKNLTDLSEVKQHEQTVQFQANEEHFYYQGELVNKSLPWHLSITYLLDGEDIHPDELAGQSGVLDIQIKTKENKSVDPLFFEHYLLQISLTLDPLTFDNIQAPKGTEVNEGKNKQINFSILPDKEETLIVSAHVNELAMDPIQIAAIPANILIDDPDTGSMTNDLQSLSSAIRDVNLGVKTLYDSMSELSTGMTDIKDGSSSYKNGINELDNSSTELIDGSKQIKGGLKRINQAITNNDSITEQDLSELKLLPKGLHKLSTELTQFAQFLNGLDEAINAIPSNTVTEEQLNELYKILETSDGSKETIQVIKQLETNYYVAQNIKQIKSNIPGKLGDGLIEVANQLDNIANNVEVSIQDLQKLDDLKELVSGLAVLSDQYNKFHNGILSYTDGVNSLATSYTELDTGLSELTNGLNDIRQGTKELYKGTIELQENTDDLPDQMEEEIENFLEDYDYDDFDPISFVSSENKNVEVVQFVLQTDKIEVEEEEIIEEEQEVEKGIWERFIDLFK